MRFRTLLALFRPCNCLVAALGPWSSAVFMGESPLESPARLLWAAAFLLTAGANTLNDVFDLEIDRVNAPHRPLPSGQASPAAASWLAAACFAAGVLLCFRARAACGILAAGQALLLVFYARWSKRLGALKNPLFVGYCASVPWLVPLALGRSDLLVLCFSAGTFWVLWALELFRDITDIAGDSASGGRTIATLYGARRARIAALAAGLLGWACGIVPVFLGRLGTASLALATLGLLVGLRALWTRPDRHPERWVLAGGLTGLLGYFLRP